MELLAITLSALVLAGIGYLIYSVNLKHNEEVDLAAEFRQLDANVQNVILKELNGLNSEVNKNLEQGRNELKQIQSQNIGDTQSLMMKAMGMIETRMDEMGHGLGEISKVGDFMQLLFNPSARGRVGEVQLEGLLCDILAPTQYEKNFQPHPLEGIRVEFAIKMPTDLGEHMYLPVDSKFPKEEYERLMQAEGKDEIEKSQRALRSKIKEFAKSISRYISVPRTTDMAIMYLPDGIFEWVASQSDLVTEIRNEHKVVITGPSTLWMIISFVSHFFKLVAINDKSREVWNLLGKFKKQMGMTLKVVDKAIDYNDKVGRNLDQLKSTRYNQMMRELRDIEEDIDGDEIDSNKAA